ncbi:phosphoglycerate kinase, partial [Candidatus Peregrinibacteria bacterium]|nr:phosphoglycerate kinase [Candidatus Peregrinibacteria bacterium]
MQYRTLDQAALRGKRVLLRAGFDVPVEEGNVVDTERIEAILPTMRFILDAPVAFAPSCAGPETLALALSLEPGHVLLLENLRFHAGEKKNDPS